MRFSRGQTIFFEGDDAKCFFEVVSGTVRCCGLIQDGRRQIHRFAGPGELLGLGGEKTFNYSAEAVDEVVVLIRDLSSLDEAIGCDGDLRRKVLDALRSELAAVRCHTVLLGRMNAIEKLAAFLLALSTRSNGIDSLIELPMTRIDIADFLGLTIETVSRKLHELHREGVIALDGPNRVRIADRRRMEAISEAA